MLGSWWQNLLQETDGANGVAADGPFNQYLFNGLMEGGGITGVVHAGRHWTPDVFAPTK